MPLLFLSKIAQIGTKAKFCWLGSQHLKIKGKKSGVKKISIIYYITDIYITNITYSLLNLNPNILKNYTIDMILIKQS